MSTPGIIKNRKGNFSLLVVPALSLLFLLFVRFTTGIRSDHILLVVLVNAGFVISSHTRRLFTGLAIIIIYWIIFDSMKAWPNYEFNDVNVYPLYALEKSLFGIRIGNEVLTPNEFLLGHTSSFLDVVCGIFYLGWVPLPLLFAFYLYFKHKNLFLRFCFAFFIVNIIGFIIYYLHPAAPPWYFEKYGSALDIHTKSYAAGLLRFDHLFGIHLFEGLYSKGSNVFAAMPSLHASYPLIGFIYACKQPSKFLRFIFALFMPGIWFSAVYLNHHYILDVLAGIGCGLLGVFLLEKVFLKTKWFRNFLNAYESQITS
jgi:membrane-associated phospholipid phosphatase